MNDIRRNLWDKLVDPLESRSADRFVILLFTCLLILVTFDQLEWWIRCLTENFWKQQRQLETQRSFIRFSNFLNSVIYIYTMLQALQKGNAISLTSNITSIYLKESIMAVIRTQIPMLLQFHRELLLFSLTVFFK